MTDDRQEGMGDALFGTRLGEQEPRSTSQSGRDLFIVDNSVSGWTALRYLEEWTEIAKSFDIATGYFEVGSLLALDGKWQGLEKIRILMGSDMTLRTKRALLEAVAAKLTNELNQSIEVTKEQNPFLNGVPAIVEALRSRQIECRVYDQAKFHAKTYITHAKLEVVGSQALVGSSNFTKPGLTENIELNVQIQSAREVAQLQEWFDIHWERAVEVTDTVIDTIERHTREYTPFDIYAKALQEFFKGHELTESEWDETESRMFPALDRYQKEAYWALMKIARQFGGAFLCDGVGLGKTFVGLMLIERLILRDGKRVVLLAPKATKEGVWDPHIREWLPHIGGVSGSSDFSNLAVFSHTDLGRGGDFPERFRRMTDLADVVIIDEAHHFRNRGRRGTEDGAIQSRYYKLYDMLDQASRSKAVFLLTATPINNRLTDFRHMTELFTRQQENYFARTIGVNNLTAYFNRLERQFRSELGTSSPDYSDRIDQAHELLGADHLFRQLVVQRSRAYAKESQIRETGQATIFPEREPPIVAEYSIRKSYGHLLDTLERAFEKKEPLFTLPMYYPLAWYKGDDSTIDPLEENRQQQVVGLIRTLFLKRFESSVQSFELSCSRLLKKVVAFIEVHSPSAGDKRRLERWSGIHQDVLGYARQLGFEEIDEELDEDFIPEEMLANVEKLDPEEFDIPEMLNEAFLDLDQLAAFLEETRKFDAKQDDKLQKLVSLLKTKDLSGQKVLIFTEFADTARYLHHALSLRGIQGLAQVDSGTQRNRALVIREFAPYYNRSSSPELVKNGEHEIDILISTDVLSEGLNLQDATRLINYDIHWNPVRLMQRIGRVDRRMNPQVEAALLKDHPEQKIHRGKVKFWNFLPPDELNVILSLYQTVTRKTLLISKTFGIEGKKLLTPDDDYEALREFNHSYEGTKTTVEELHLEYQALIQEDPELESYLDRLPGSVFSSRIRESGGLKSGVFFCYSLPALDSETGSFTEVAGTTRWYLYDRITGEIVEEPSTIVGSVRSERDTSRATVTDEEWLKEIRTAIENHIKNTYLKRVDAPVGVKPALKCWMEIKES